MEQAGVPVVAPVVARAAGPVVAIGFAFAAQEVAMVPVDGFDQRLDMVVTESGVRRFG